MSVILADENINFVKEAFAGFGEVKTMAGRAIDRAAVRDASMLLVRSVTRVDGALLDGSAVRFVATATAGADHVDEDELQARHIGFAYAPGSNARSVAEYVAASLLAWSRRSNRPLAGLAIGIIGVGNVGRLVMKMAQTLGMRCLLNDPPLQRLTSGTVFVPIERLLAEADIVTLHVPLIEGGADATLKMVNAGFLSHMKKGALLLNMSRGQVMDEVLVRKRRDDLCGLILDVWENEPGVSLETLAAAEQATPHIAGYSFDGKIQATAMIREAACAFHFKELPPFDVSADDRDTRALTIDVSKATDQIHDAVLTACPVTEDDKRMRDIVKDAPDKRGPRFDALRKNYPRRREFPNWTVTGAKGESRKVLTDLGFIVT